MLISQDSKTVARLDHVGKIFSRSNWVYLKKILCKEMEYTVSPILTLDLTQNCNYNCYYCVDRKVVQRKHLKEIPWDTLKDLLTELRANGCRGIEITGGGEPSLYGEFKEFLKHSTELNFRLALISNGSMLHQYVNDLISSSLDWIRISLDASTSSTYSLVHGTEPSIFGDLLKSIVTLAQSKVVGISYIVLPFNYEDIYDSAYLVKSLGVRYFEVKPLLDSESKNIFSYEHMVIQRIKEQFQKMRELEDENFKIIYPKSLSNICLEEDISYAKDYSFCWAAYLRTVLTPAGVYPCSYFRGRILPISFPSTVKELIEHRNKAIATINPSRSCVNYCGRDEINKIIKTLFYSISQYPNLINHLGWPVDQGEDVLWL